MDGNHSAGKAIGIFLLSLPVGLAMAYGTWWLFDHGHTGWGVIAGIFTVLGFVSSISASLTGRV